MGGLRVNLPTHLLAYSFKIYVVKIIFDTLNLSLKKIYFHYYHKFSTYINKLNRLSGSKELKGLMG